MNKKSKKEEMGVIFFKRFETTLEKYIDNNEIFTEEKLMNFLQ